MVSLAEAADYIKSAFIALGSTNIGLNISDMPAFPQRFNSTISHWQQTVSSTC